MERIDTGAEDSSTKNAIFDLKAKIRERYEDHNRSIMTLCGGDPVQFNEIKSGTVGLYLFKLDNFVSGIERDHKTARRMKRK